MEILEGKKDKEVSEEKIEDNTDVDVKNLENSEEENQPQEESEKSVESETENKNDSENEASENVEDENKWFIDLSGDGQEENPYSN